MTQSDDRFTAGAKLLRLSIDRTKANCLRIRETRHSSWSDGRKKTPGLDRRIDQQLNSFTAEEQEAHILAKLELLEKDDDDGIS